jgi:hypothetical protein
VSSVELVLDWVAVGAWVAHLGMLFAHAMLRALITIVLLELI